MTGAAPLAGATVQFCALGATERLDRFLADQLQLSRTVAARLIGEKAVTIDGRVARASAVLERGQVVVVQLPGAVPARPLVPADIPLRVVFEDAHLLVLDKPAGLVVHPAPGHWEDTLVNALVARGIRLGAGAEGLRPGIVHRLDRDTSGLMIVAKSDTAHRRLQRAIAARQVRRTYAALAWGHLDAPRTRVDAPLARHPRDRQRMAVQPGGREARTDVRVVARFDVAELLRLELQTGRTHQIRVHLEHLGHPIVGDPVYAGGGSRRIGGRLRQRADQLQSLAPRQALHAAALAFRHPESGDPLEFRSEWPADLRPALAFLAGEAVVAGGDGLRYLQFYDGDS